MSNRSIKPALVFKVNLVVLQGEIEFLCFLGARKIPRNSPGNPRGTIFIPRFPGEGKSSPKKEPYFFPTEIDENLKFK